MEGGNHPKLSIGAVCKTGKEIPAIFSFGIFCVLTCLEREEHSRAMKSESSASSKDRTQLAVVSRDKRIFTKTRNAKLSHRRFSLISLEVSTVSMAHGIAEFIKENKI